MLRLLFEKKGNAVWISHLDLMRLFQRAFKRAGFSLTHTQGYNPRPSVSIALPLSVGVESCCELLDFELEGNVVSYEEICHRLNEGLVDGIQVLEVYSVGQKIRDIAYLKCIVSFEYDNGVPENAVSDISELFNREEIVVVKKGKNGLTEINIIPMIQSVNICHKAENTLEIEAVICCQNPSLNPMLLVSAMETYLPDLKPSFSHCRRIEIYDRNHNIFR